MAEETDSDDRERGGLDSDEFRRRFVLVTFAVFGLGIVGGTCLGYKIERAERIQEKREHEKRSAEEPTRSIPEKRANDNAP